MRNRKAVVVPLFCAMFGLFAFMQVVSRPRFETYHAVDVVQLMGSGVLLGVALAAAIMRLRPPSKE
jgi:hypothetical protein